MTDTPRQCLYDKETLKELYPNLPDARIADMLKLAVDIENYDAKLRFVEKMMSKEGECENYEEFMCSECHEWTTSCSPCCPSQPLCDNPECPEA